MNMNLELFFAALAGGVALTAGATLALLAQAVKVNRWSESQSVAWFSGAIACFIIGAVGTSYIVIKIAMMS